MHRRLRPLFAFPLCRAGACGSGDSAGPGTPSPQPGDIVIVVGASQMSTTAFNPDTKSVSLGGNSSVSVRWFNSDAASGGYRGTGVAHQITSDGGAFAQSPALAVGAAYSVELTAAGTYHYHCAIHPNMVGTITVAP
jgi:plastocyanin